ncbi:Uncharacterised protein [Escherichia coli]|nr:Uncharacterised protein [Escherichia coli]CTW99504.1 Uncharacterised protein [Escherichia coli]
MAVVTRRLSSPLPLVRRRLKRTPFTTRGVSHFACARYWPSAALTSTVRCCTAGGMTLFRVPLWSPSKCAPLSTMASFSGTCCTAVMAKVPSVFSRMETQRNRRRRSDGRESPHTPYVSTPSGRVLTCIRSGAGCAVMSTLTGLPLPLIRFTVAAPVSGSVTSRSSVRVRLAASMDRTRPPVMVPA